MNAFDYKKLTADATAAIEAGELAAKSVDDGGACNFDGVVLKLPRQKESAVVQALAQAGIQTRRSNFMLYGTGYMINPKTDGQANKRMVASEAIGKHLKAAGYDVSQFYLMD